MQDFDGKVALITGGGRGIGRGIALRCAREGMKIILAGYGKESITKTKADLEALGAEVAIFQVDVSDAAQVNAFAEQAFDAFGRVDLLVNNAGVASPGTVLGSTTDDWNWVMGVNFYGVLYCVRAFVPRMMQQADGGHVVNVSSVSGLFPGGGGSYGVSKHAVVVLSESLYHELGRAESNVKVTVYCPGWVSTELHSVDRSRPERFKHDFTAVSDEMREAWKGNLAAGISIEDSADILFKALREDKLYVGLVDYDPEDGSYVNAVRKRTEYILNEENPPIASPSSDPDPETDDE